MKKILCRLLATLPLMAVPAMALADTSVSSTTILRFSQDTRTGAKKQNFLPATQFLGVDMDKLGDGNLSLHLYGWGRVDFLDKSYNDDAADGSLTYAYAKYRFQEANATLRAGRLIVTEGIINEQVDGLSARTDLPLGFGISAFGGATVHTVHMAGEKTDGKGDSIWGGRLNYRYRGLLELGVSGVYESGAPALENRLLVDEGKFGSHRLVGGDLWLNPHRMVEIMGHTSYNTETDGVAEHSYLVNVKPLHGLVVAGEFNEHNERNLMYSSILFAGMLENLNEKSRSLGGSASYELSKTVAISGDYKHYTRDIGKADRFGGDARFTLQDKGIRAGFGYHYLRSGPDFAVIPSADSSGSFHELRGYAMHENKKYFAAVDALGYFFRQDINNRSRAWELIASTGYYLTSAMALSGDLSYGRNPQYDSEFKGLVRLTYNMNYAAKGGTK